MGYVSVVAAGEFLRLARELRVSGAVVLAADPGDRAGIGLLKWADRFELVAEDSAVAPRLVLVEDERAEAG